MSTELIIDHNAGFFSCCSVRLARIIEFFNKHKREPKSIDWSKQFAYYKINHEDVREDINLLYFSAPNKNINISYNHDLYFTWDDQFEPYSNIDFLNIIPFIQKYFEPSTLVKQLLFNFEQKYSIDYKNTIGVCYRGNDKHRETKIALYDEFLNKCKKLHQAAPASRFFLQTDETEFKNIFIKTFPNTYYFEELPTINSNRGAAIHHFISLKDKPMFAALFLSSILSLSKCETVVTHSGNCGIWILLYRNNSKNTYQFLNHKTNNLGWLKL